MIWVTPGLQVPENNYDHDYIKPEAARRTRDDLPEYLKQRKACGCEGAD